MQQYSSNMERKSELEPLLANEDAFKVVHAYKTRKSCSSRVFPIMGALALVLTAILAVSLIWQPALHSTDAGANEIYKEISKVESVRLPAGIAPSRYNLDIVTKLSTATFSGSVAIDIHVDTPTQFIAIHQLELSIGAITLDALTAAPDLTKPFDPKTLSTDTKYEVDHIANITQFQYLEIYFKQTIEPGYYNLKVDFAGKLQDTLEGFYRSSYTNKHTGKKEYLATTQMEPVHARKAFPCFDEPEFKAIFVISITTESEYHAISNMPATSVKTLPSGLVKYSFAPTLRMSSYLIAYIVSNFESIEAKTKNGVIVRVFTQRQSTDLGKYALEVAVKVMEYFQATYAIPFPLPKCDLIAIPDFQAGAMENWGLITFRDTALLYDPKVSSQGNKQGVASTIAHELAHQWFGNLVTMKWWSDLWLNEGFAEFMTYKGTHAAEPEWKMLEQFLPGELMRAENADESIFTHPIAIPVKNPEEIQEIFDDISYGKGSAVLRMLEGYLETKFGQNYFFTHLTSYLNSHSYGNADTSQLWQALQNPGSPDIAAFMSTWTDQPGFPLVTVSFPSTDDSTKKSSFQVTQKRYIFSGLVDPLSTVPEKLIPPVLNVPKDPSTQTWAIPLTFALFSNHTGKVKRVSDPTVFEFFTHGPIQVDLATQIPKDTIVLANYGKSGVYRVQYDERTLHYLLEWLRADINVFSAVERAGLLSDVFSFTYSGQLSDVTIALEFMKLMEHEESTIVWGTAIREFRTLKKAFAHHPSYGLIQQFEQNVIHKMVKSIGWVETSKDTSQHHMRALLRGLLLQEAVRSGHKKTIATALDYFKLLMEGKKDKVDVTADALTAILVAGVMYGDEANYEWVLQQHLNSTFAPEKSRYLFALASSPVSYLQMRTLDLTLTDKIRKQDITSLVENVASSTPVGHLTAWIFLMDNWAAIAKWKDYNMTGLGAIIQDIIGKFTNSYLVSEAQRLFVDRKDPDLIVPDNIMVAVFKGLETSRQLVKWQGMVKADVAAWLRKELDIFDASAQKE
ncbi:Aminopeptidase 2 mitochondrial, variant 2 [Batrachochytrium dendrobatidis]|nr:Aminopeptidase 2 mitochondrial [Batrachochytrium dendrobatidis]KAK5665202.1 Aminopeptidase 2 mitochondrial, variant 2 [Batrachochytrium dendrobatidis]